MRYMDLRPNMWVKKEYQDGSQTIYTYIKNQDSNDDIQTIVVNITREITFINLDKDFTNQTTDFGNTDSVEMSVKDYSIILNNIFYKSIFLDGRIY